MKRQVAAQYPIKIETAPTEVPPGLDPTWTDATSQFTVTIDADDRKTMVITRTSGGTFNGLRYRITPITSTSTPPTGFTRLKCRDVANEPVVQPWTYEIIVPIP